jgi:hypothetical protein
MSNPTAEACADVSRYMREHDARLDMMKSNPLLFLAYYVEAAGDRRIEGDVIAPSVLASLSDMARTMVAKHEGRWEGNPLFPDGRSNSRRRVA